MTTDLTQGNPFKLLFFFSLPLLAGNLFQQFYSTVDAIIVGRFVGEKALAAVGVTGSINFFVLGAVIGLTLGFSIIISQVYGAKDEAGLRHTIAVSIELSVCFAIVLTIISVLSSRFLLSSMQTPTDIFSDAHRFLIILFFGIPGLIFYNLFSGILRAVGNSKIPLIFLVIACILNIILDILFVVTFKMGTAGAAFATVISQTLAGILCFFYMLYQFPFLIPKGKDWKFSMDLAKKLILLGIPSALSNSVCALGCMAVQGSVNQFGSEIVAGYTAGTKIEAIAHQPCFAFSAAIGTYVAQNIGAKRMDRVRKGVHECLKLLFGAALFGLFISFFFTKPLVHFFLQNPSNTVIEAAVTYMNIISPFIFILGVLCSYRSAIAGMGNAKIPFISGVIELAMRVPVSFIAGHFFGYPGVSFASPAAWLGGAILVVFSYYSLEHTLHERFYYS